MKLSSWLKNNLKTTQPREKPLAAVYKNPHKEHNKNSMNSIHALIVGTALSMGTIFATTAEEWGASVSFETKVGNNRILGSTNLFLPLAQDENSLIFGDLRIVGDTKNSTEGNAGFGFRQLNQEETALYGGYIFADHRRSSEDNRFNQITVGAEYLTENWDFRVNSYHPITGKRSASGGGAPRVQLDGNSIVYYGGAAFETPLQGMDIEIGRRLAGTENTRAFIGGYSFGRGNQPNIDGIRFRLQSDINNVLRVGAELSNDQYRGHNAYYSARVTLPLNPTEWLAAIKEPSKKPHTLRSRMVEPIVRDIDVVTQKDLTNAAPVALAAIDAPATEKANIFIVDNSASSNGNGGIDSPFNNLADAAALAGAGDTIYIRTGTGTNFNLNAAINANGANMKILGEGVDLVLNPTEYQLPSDAPVFEAQTLISAGSNPIITNTSGNVIEVSADDVEISGLTINGASGDAIASANAANLRVTNNTLSGNSGSGVNAAFSGTTNGQSLTVEDNQILSNTGNGVEITTNGTSALGMVNLNRNDLNNNNNGLSIELNGGSTIAALNIEDNNINNNATVGQSTVLNNGVITSLNFEGNRGTANIENSSIFQLLSSTSSIETLNAEDNIFSNSTNRDGMTIAALNGSNITTASVVSNTFANNGRHGLYILTSGGATINALTANQISTSSNTDYGINLQINNGNITTLTLEENYAANNTQGIYLSAISTANISNTILTNNQTLNNTNNGIYVESAINSLINNATVSGTTSTGDQFGIYAIAKNASTIENLNLSNNILNAASQYGLRIEANGAGSEITSASIIGNTASGTTVNDGIYITAQSGAVITAATASSNTTNNSARHGLQALAFSSGEIGELNITNHASSGNTRDGLRIAADTNAAIGSLNITGTNSSNNGESGALINNFNSSTISETTILTSIFDNNGDHGLYLPTSGNGEFGSIFMQSSSLVGNGQQGFYINDNTPASTPITDIGGGALGSTGQNRIFNNGKDVLVDLDGLELKAQNNYWGSVTGLDQGADASFEDLSTIDASLFLTADPF